MLWVPPQKNREGFASKDMGDNNMKRRVVLLYPLEWERKKENLSLVKSIQMAVTCVNDLLKEIHANNPLVKYNSFPPVTVQGI